MREGVESAPWAAMWRIGCRGVVGSRGAQIAPVKLRFVGQDYVPLVVRRHCTAGDLHLGLAIFTALEGLQVRICEDVHRDTPALVQGGAEHLYKCRKFFEAPGPLRDLLYVCGHTKVSGANTTQWHAGNLQ